MSEVKLFTYEEIAKHNKLGDLWMVINNKVYDITAFVDEHPGGEEVLVDEGAKDATGPFDDVGHSPDAREMLNEYYIGDVDPNSLPVKVNSSTNTTSATQPQGNAFRILIPLVMLIAFAYYRFTTSA